MDRCVAYGSAPTRRPVLDGLGSRHGTADARPGGRSLYYGIPTRRCCSTRHDPWNGASAFVPRASHGAFSTASGPRYDGWLQATATGYSREPRSTHGRGQLRNASGQGASALGYGAAAPYLSTAVGYAATAIGWEHAVGGMPTCSGLASSFRLKQRPAARPSVRAQPWGTTPATGALAQLTGPARRSATSRTAGPTGPSVGSKPGHGANSPRVATTPSRDTACLGANASSTDTAWAWRRFVYRRDNTVRRVSSLNASHNVRPQRSYDR